MSRTESEPVKARLRRKWQFALRTLLLLPLLVPVLYWLVYWLMIALAPAEEAVIEMYRVDNFPVWQKTDNGEFRFDPSALIALIKATVAPKTWEKSGRITANGTDAIVVVQTRPNHNKVKAILNQLKQSGSHKSDQERTE